MMILRVYSSLTVFGNHSTVIILAVNLLTFNVLIRLIALTVKKKKEGIFSTSSRNHETKYAWGKYGESYKEEITAHRRI